MAVLYEGRQIFFGPTHEAKEYFINLGFECLPRQTTADFLTSITNPAERRVSEAFKGKTPKTPDDFVAVWLQSPDRSRLLEEIEEFKVQHPIDGSSLDEFRHSKRVSQAKTQ